MPDQDILVKLTSTPLGQQPIRQMWLSPRSYSHIAVAVRLGPLLWVNAVALREDFMRTVGSTEQARIQGGGECYYLLRVRSKIDLAGPLRLSLVSWEGNSTQIGRQFAWHPCHRKEAKCCTRSLGVSFDLPSFPYSSFVHHGLINLCMEAPEWIAMRCCVSASFYGRWRVRSRADGFLIWSARSVRSWSKSQRGSAPIHCGSGTLNMLEEMLGLGVYPIRLVCFASALRMPIW